MDVDFRVGGTEENAALARILFEMDFVTYPASIGAAT